MTNRLYIVGKSTSTDGKQWEFQGVFDDSLRAVAACQDSRYFVGPADLNVEIADVGLPWPNAFRPNLAPPPAAKQECCGDCDFTVCEIPPVSFQFPSVDLAAEIFRALEKKERGVIEQKLYEQACTHLATSLQVVVSIEPKIAECLGSLRHS